MLETLLQWRPLRSYCTTGATVERRAYGMSSPSTCTSVVDTFRVFKTSTRTTGLQIETLARTNERTNEGSGSNMPSTSDVVRECVIACSTANPFIPSSSHPIDRLIPSAVPTFLPPSLPPSLLPSYLPLSLSPLLLSFSHLDDGSSDAPTHWFIGVPP
eukprot:GHVU01023998.1.p2 GENE.GHVU01023998.1~~GHVU01023998.1.p2  ORF type:complete len:158 (-),score=14.15 GHVU01023998.1:1691-2164(-)